MSFLNQGRLAALLVFALLFSFSSCQEEKNTSEEEQIERPILEEVVSESEHKEAKAIASATKHIVTIEKMQFLPANLTIAKGDTIVWINKGVVVHDVTEEPSKKWTSGEIEIGEVWEMIPVEGFNYFCSIHTTMKGSVVVAN